MRVRLAEFMELARSSFWFLPSVMMLVGVLLFSITLGLDRSDMAAPWLTRVLYSGGVENAVYLLQTLTAAMVAIATVVFSTLMLVLTLATSQFGHRLIRSFMRDRANQAVLGVFLSTFVYCMLVFHMVGNDPANRFVPALSVTVGFGLSLFASCTLIYFTHHMAQLIAAPQVLEAVAVELDDVIDRLYPESPAQRHDEGFSLRNGELVRAPRAGYVQSVGLDGVVAVAQQHDIRIESLVGYGDYVLAGAPIARWQGSPDDQEDGLAEKIAGEYLIGDSRMSDRDLLFAINQVAEIAVRALSPALNNPYTAVDCINRLGASLAEVARRPEPSPLHGENPRPRFSLGLPDFEAALDAAFTPIRNYGRGSVLASRQLLRTLGGLGAVATREPDRAALRRHAQVVRDAAHSALQERHDIDDIEREFERALNGLRQPA